MRRNLSDVGSNSDTSHYTSNRQKTETLPTYQADCESNWHELLLIIKTSAPGAQPQIREQKQPTDERRVCHVNGGARHARGTGLFPPYLTLAVTGLLDGG